MNESTRRVATTSRLAQWRIENISAFTFRESYPFQIGLWNWRLSVERRKQTIVTLLPEASSSGSEPPPIASFIIRVVCFTGQRRQIVHPEVREKQLKCSDGFVWAIEPEISGKVIIDVEFIDLKKGGIGDQSSMWVGDQISIVETGAALTALRQMLSDGAATDVTINASDGTVAAHQAILAARSPVFRSMFSHDLKEKALATVNITDMCASSCAAFIQYLYGCATVREFLDNRVSLLRASDKYDVCDLRRACEDSLQEDIDGDNILERLQMAHLYRLSSLKTACMRYLVEFGRICDLRDELSAFLLIADRELVADVFYEVILAWKGG